MLQLECQISYKLNKFTASIKRVFCFNKEIVLLSTHFMFYDIHCYSILMYLQL